MSEHYTANTGERFGLVQPNRNTQHSVSGNRRGRCLEHEAPQFSQRQLARREKLEQCGESHSDEDLSLHKVGEGLGRNITVQLTKTPQPEELAACGASHCAGCYEVEPGIRIHPPRSEW